MKSLLIVALALITTTQAMAAERRITLNRDTRVMVSRGGSYLDELVTFRSGTRVLINDRVRMKDGMKAVRLLKVYDVDSLRNDYRYNTARDINRDFRDMRDGYRPYNKYFISSRVLRSNPRPIDRPVVIDRPAITTQTIYTTSSYEMCYEKPRRRYVVIDKKQNQRGTALTGIGVILGIGGQIIGGDVGNVVTGVGVGLGIVGLVDLSQSTETIFDTTVDCRRYYQTEVRRVYVRNRSCTTTRYYTNGWGRTTEYFETTCGSSRYMTFERNSEIWY